MVNQCQLSMHPSGSVNEYQQKLGLNGHTTRCTSTVSEVSQLQLVYGRGIMKWRSALLYGSMKLGKNFTFVFTYTSNNMLITDNYGIN